ncbi:PGF-CTERM-anchored ABC transporter substrate-binding protein [Natronobiforma cellulositropha]|uniref:PGF-CTERM-anchored ABC transporter substrate-binding protein n=1 Tax=Natronobiforma cellulositropha TaxID=1679076 RepID=UPI0021D5A07F|nr:PGF-CTERM-anchored ABC transporter substrate-binding protein [Natronobiforma cellulositropha]
MRLLPLVFVALVVLAGTAGPAAALGDGDGSIETVEECGFPLTVTDATGAELTLEEPPERVVTLNPSAAQTLWEIGADDRVVGVTKHATNLEGADERTNISTPAETIEPERVVGLEPDLVIAPGSNYVGEELVEVLREAGLTVYHYPSADSIDTVYEQTRLIGALVDECDGAEATTDWMDEELAAVDAALEGEDRPAVLYEFFEFTAGEGTFVHEILERAGGDNIAAEAGIEGYQLVNEETVVEYDPEWLVLNTNSPEVPESEAFAATSAVQSDQVVVVDVNLLNRPGPRIVDAITTLAATFHPEAYAEARAEASTDAETESTADDSSGAADAGDTDADGERADDTDEADDSSDAADASADDDGSPGFGTLLAVGVLVVAALSIRQRDGGA